MVDARTGAIRKNTQAIERLARAQEEIVRQMKITNMLSAAQFQGAGLETEKSWAMALHTEAIELIGVKP